MSHCRRLRAGGGPVIKFQQMDEFLAALVPASELEPVQKGAQDVQFLPRQTGGEPLKIEGLGLYLRIADGGALLRDIQLFPAAVLRMGPALNVAPGLQLGGPAGDGALVLAVLLTQLLLGDAGAVLDGMDHVIVG